LSRPLEWPRAVSSLAPCYFLRSSISPALTKSDAAPGADIAIGSSSAAHPARSCASPAALAATRKHSHLEERILPARRNRPIEISLPKIADASDLIAAAAALTDAVARGDITPNEASALSNLVEIRPRRSKRSNCQSASHVGRLRP
jgi:hypothetical protein